MNLNRETLPRVDGTQNNRREYFLISPKADGSRVLLGVADRHACTMDRKGEATRVPIQGLPAKTLLDAECLMVDGTTYFLVFDCFIVNDKPCVNLPYHQRLQLAHEVVRRLPGEDVSIDWSDGILGRTRNVRQDRYVVAVKPAYQMDIRNVVFPFPQDGFVITKVTEPVRVDHPSIFKWKPTEKQTVDFRCVPDNGSRSMYGVDPERQIRGPLFLLVRDGRNEVIFAGTPMVPHVHMGRIYECYWNGEYWQIIQERADKTSPNTLGVAEDTVLAQKENITLSEIGNFE